MKPDIKPRAAIPPILVGSSIPLPIKSAASINTASAVILVFLAVAIFFLSGADPGYVNPFILNGPFFMLFCLCSTTIKATVIFN